MRLEASSDSAAISHAAISHVAANWSLTDPSTNALSMQALLSRSTVRHDGPLTWLTLWLGASIGQWASTLSAVCGYIQDLLKHFCIIEVGVSSWYW
jgi:hypothetical protein